MIPLVLLVAASAAVLDEEALVEAVQAEMARSQAELQLPGVPSIYHLRYKLGLLDQFSVSASFGGINSVGNDPFSGLGVEVRIGDPSFDNTGFGGWRNGFRVIALPRVPTPLTVRQDVWHITDSAFKEAVEQLSRKTAQAVLPPDHPGDYSLTGAVEHDGGTVALVPAEHLMSLAEQLSARFAAVPQLERGEVHIGYEAGSLWVLDTEGSRVRIPRSEISVRALGHLRTDDGMKLTDQRLWTLSDPADLPPLAEMAAEVSAMAADLARLAEVPVLEDEWVGPVLFEGEAAADLFRYLLLPQLEGTPPEIPFDTWIGAIGERQDSVRVGRRVLPEGWAVADDPALVPEHPGAYGHDWEGSPAERVELVTDGIVHDLLMARVPRKGLDGTNGHGRATLSHRALGKPSLTEVSVKRTRSTRALRRRGLRLASSYGHDKVLVVRRLQEPATRHLDGGFVSLGDDGGLRLPPPVEVIFLHADGREESVRGARFSGVQRWLLRDIVAAGRPVTLDYLSPLDGDYDALSPTAGAPCRLLAHDVLVGEMEVVPASGDPSEARVLPPPSLSAVRD